MTTLYIWMVVIAGTVNGQPVEIEGWQKMAVFKNPSYCQATGRLWQDVTKAICVTEPRQ